MTPNSDWNSRRNPRIGPNPSLLEWADVTACDQSTVMPSSLWRSRNVCPATCTGTGVVASAAAFCSSRLTASFVVMPPTSTPAMVVPSASVLGEPA